MKKIILLLSFLLNLTVLDAKEVKCDIFIPGMRFKVTQKLSEHEYGAMGNPMGYGQHGRIEYKGLSYGRMRILTLKKNSYMKSHAVFKHSRNVIGYFNYIGPEKAKLDNGFSADVLVLKECPDVHKLIAAEEKKVKEQQRKQALINAAKEKKEKKRREQALKKERAKKKAFESLYE